MKKQLYTVCTYDLGEMACTNLTKSVASMNNYALIGKTISILIVSSVDSSFKFAPSVRRKRKHKQKHTYCNLC